MLLQAPGGREATGARGARHSWMAGGALQGPASPQSLFCAQALPGKAPELLLDEDEEPPSTPLGPEEDEPASAPL